MNKYEIKKALECCMKGDCCYCPYYDGCTQELTTDALVIITKQEKEIEKQNSRVKTLKNRLNEKYAHISNAETEYEKAFELLKAQRQEIDILKENLKNLKDDFESLQKDYEFVRDCDADHCLEIEETVKQAKIDVLNELTVKAVSLSAIETYHICNLVEELIKEIEK